MENKNIYFDTYTEKIIVNEDIIFKRTTIRNDDYIKVETTGHNYDFIATIENKTENTILIVFDDESDYLPEITINAYDWIGLLANDTGYETLKALANNKFHKEWKYKT